MTVVVDKQQLRAFIEEKCNISSVRNFQLDGATHIIEGRDLVLVIVSGSGKTLVCEGLGGDTVKAVPNSLCCYAHNSGASKNNRCVT